MNDITGAAAAAAAEVAAIGEELERLTQMLYQLPVGVLRCRLPDGAVELMNPLVVKLAAHLLQRWSGDSVYTLFESCFPDLRSLVQGHAQRHGVIFESRRIHVPPARAGDQPQWLAMTAMRVDEASFALVVADITREVEREYQIRQAGAWISALVHSSGAHMACLLDEGGRITRWMPYAERLTGWTASQVQGLHVSHLFVEEFGLRERLDARLSRAAASGWDLDDSWMRRGGLEDASPFFASSIVTLLDGGRAERYALVARDMTDRREATESLRRLTVRDHLTGVYNRAFLFNAGEDEVAKACLVNLSVAVILVDVDRFKRVNDTWGHAVGDVALRHVASVLQRVVRGNDVVGRLGGEEFVVLLPGCELPRAVAIAEQMRAMLEAEPAAAGDLVVPLTASFGVASARGSDIRFSELVGRADGAVYDAKAGGRNCVVAAAPVPSA